MAASFTYDPGVGQDPGVSTLASAIVVCRYLPTSSPGFRYRVLPNVECDRIQYREGAAHPAAQFRYVFDHADPDDPYPRDFSQVWGEGATGPYVVRPGDRIVVLEVDAAGRVWVLFHGFAANPQVDVGGEDQHATFLGHGVAVRLWDRPISGAFYRDATDPEEGEVVGTGLAAEFNPDGLPNCTPDEHDVEEVEVGIGGIVIGKHPVFIERHLKGGEDIHSPWTVGKLCRYLLARHNDQAYVQNPDFTVLDALLEAYLPVNGEYYNPDDPSTYTKRGVPVRGYDATGKALPDALGEQLGAAGFAFRFQTEEDAAGEPWDTIEVYRRDAGSGEPARPLRLQPRGAVYQPGRSNVAEFHAVRDSHNVANQFRIQTAPVAYEVSIVLAPDFVPDPDDATSAGRKKYLRAEVEKSTDPAIVDGYRTYVGDETGRFHWDFAESAISFTPLDLDAVLDGPEEDPANGGMARRYVRRLRPPQRTLHTRGDRDEDGDGKGEPLKARLDFSRDYEGPCPAVWDGTGGWQPIAGGWQLLKDRIGIRVTADDPEAWPIGDFKGDDRQEPGKVLRGISSIADPSEDSQGRKRFYLRLTCVIEGDRPLDATAARRQASPVPFTVERVIDSRDHFKKQVISPCSVHYPEPPEPPEEGEPWPEAVAIDQTDEARAYARALQAAHELPTIAATVVIPGLAHDYEIGQRVDVIDGRGVDLGMGRASAEEPATYPLIVGKDWLLTNGQQTVLYLSDTRTEPGRG